MTWATWSASNGGTWALGAPRTHVSRETLATGIVGWVTENVGGDQWRTTVPEFGTVVSHRGRAVRARIDLAVGGFGIDTAIVETELGETIHLPRPPQPRLADYGTQLGAVVGAMTHAVRALGEQFAGVSRETSTDRCACGEIDDELWTHSPGGCEWVGHPDREFLHPKHTDENGAFDDD